MNGTWARIVWRALARRGMAAAAVLAAAATVAGPPHAAGAVDWSREVVDSTMQRFPEPERLPWRYARALYLQGQYLVYQRTGERRYLDYIRRWGEARVRPDGTVVDVDGEPVAFTALDSLMPGTVLALLYRETRAERYRVAVQRIRAELDGWPRTPNGGFWHGRRNNGQLWADGTYMSTSFLLEHGRTFPDAGGGARDEAARQLVAYAAKLQDGPTGLLRHAYSEPRAAPWADRVTGRSPAIWCRAVGWYGMALVNVLDALPAGHPRRPALVATLRRLVSGLARYQDRGTGRWFEVVDKGALAANWLETSCSSMHARVISRAVERGWVGPAYRRAALRARQGVLRTVSLGPGGLTNLAGAVAGTSVGDVPYYLARPRPLNEIHGLGAFLLMQEEGQLAPRR